MLHHVFVYVRIMTSESCIIKVQTQEIRKWTQKLLTLQINNKPAQLRRTSKRQEQPAENRK